VVGIDQGLRFEYPIPPEEGECSSGCLKKKGQLWLYPDGEKYRFTMSIYAKDKCILDSCRFLVHVASDFSLVVGH